MDRIEQLQLQRSELLQQMTRIGEFRPGNLSMSYKKCGKRNCRCTKMQDQRHPVMHLTRKVDGQTVYGHIPKHAADSTREQVEEYRRFKELVRQFTEVNDSLCKLRLKAQQEELKRGQLQGARKAARHAADNQK